MKLGVLVCDPGDRPDFAGQYQALIRWQTRKADAVYFVDEVRQGDETDLTERLKRGCEHLKSKVDLILIIENDDFYARYYFERMAVLWERHGKPELVGFSETVYYHLLLRSFVSISHPNRASLFSTAIASYAVDRIDWNFLKTKEPFIDLPLWKNLNGVAVKPAVIEAIGIKHGLGKIVSQGQKKDFHRYTGATRDEDLQWLQRHTGNQFSFYKNLSEKLRKSESNEKETKR